MVYLIFYAGILVGLKPKACRGAQMQQGAPRFGETIVTNLPFDLRIR